MTLVYLALAWLVGIALGAGLARPFWVWLIIAIAGASVALLGRRERPLRLGGALLALGALGALRVSLSPLYPSPLALYVGNPNVTLTGTVAAAPDLRPDHAEVTLAVETVALGHGAPQPLATGVLLRVPREAGYRYGDRLQVSGRVQAPGAGPGFSYRDYLARRGIYGLVENPKVVVLGHGAGNPARATLIALADRAEAIIGALWPAPESALLAGILLGREQAIAEPLLEAFNDTGTRHIIAISGFNITLLAGVLSAVLLTFLSRHVAVPIVIGLLAFYVALVGSDPSVVRAALMGGLVLLAALAGRRGQALTGLALSALLMTIWRPWTAWEPGFQLSFAATLGLIVLVPPLEAALAPIGVKMAKNRRVPSVPVPSWLREALLVSLAAQLATLPITLGTFGRLSLIAPLANLLILPAQAPLMELGALATLLAFLWRPLGQCIAYLAWPFTAWTVAVVEALGHLSWAAVDVAGTIPGSPLLWSFYVLAGALLWLRQNPHRWQGLRAALSRHLASKACVAGLAAAAVILWVGVLRLPDGRLHVTFLDVGQGDAILIQTPDGKRLLIDGGPDPTLLPAALARRLAPWERRLDLVALSHPDEDHLAGLLPILRAYRVGLILDTHLPRPSPSGQAWNALITQLQPLEQGGPGMEGAMHNTHSVPRVVYPVPGTTLGLGRGVQLQVLQPGEALLAGTAADDNNNSLVLRLSWGKASFLLTGDLQSEGEARLLRQQDLPLQSTILKVAHHGAQQATTQRFLDVVRPHIAVISVGADNRFGHPAPEVLARLGAAGAQVWRTDQCGDIELITDGQKLWLHTGRPCRGS